jgi:hypothetical protein
MGARMLSDVERRRVWRKRIAGLVQRQRAARQLIPISEIADWCARSVTGASADAEEQARELAYQRLDQSARRGEFERGGGAIPQSEIRYLDPEMFRLAPGMLRLRIGREQLGQDGIIRDLAGFCWLPRDLARQWLAANGYPWPTHFDPLAGAIGEAAEQGSSSPRTPVRTNQTAIETLGGPAKAATGGVGKVRKATKLDAVKAYIAEYPNGIPPGVTDKVVARAVGVSERTVRRARSDQK